MKAFSQVVTSAVVTTIALIGFTAVPGSEVPPAEVDGWASPASRTMRAFHSDSQLRSYFKAIAERHKRLTHRAPKSALFDLQNAAPLEESSKAKNEAGGAGESVTNTQHAGVDEGGIVKVHGNHLVVLRRGRLFTVAIGGDALKPISVADAFGPDINPEDT